MTLKAEEYGQSATPNASFLKSCVLFVKSMTISRAPSYHAYVGVGRNNHSYIDMKNLPQEAQVLR